MKTLTPKQQKIYDYILDFTAEHGYPPSVREIGAAVGLKSPSTVHFHLKGLEEAGVIVKAEGKTRAISLPGAGVRSHCPRILGADRSTKSQLLAARVCAR